MTACMLLPLHCSSQESESPCVDWERIMQQAAAAGAQADVLQLSLNCSNHRIASGAEAAAAAGLRAAYFAIHLETDTARRLMLTAIVRQHEHALRWLVRLEVLVPQLDAPTLEKLLALTLFWPSWTALLCTMPAARALSCDAVARLLQAAAQLGQGPWEDEHSMLPGWECTWHLCQLPAARMLSKEAAIGFGIEHLVQVHMIDERHQQPLADPIWGDLQHELWEF
jgi:hypothetical protein